MPEEYPDTYRPGDLSSILDDVKIQPSSATTSSHQPGGEIEKSFDGNMESIYHSNWTNTGDDYFPITLTYRFPTGTDMDYLIYYPRTSGYNGHFKEVEIRIKANGTPVSEEEWTTIIEKDFKGSGAATRVDFPKPQKGVSQVQLVVKSGYGDGQGFASCAEMEFYRKNPDNFDYATLFTDATCSELKAGVTEADIEDCEFGFYRTLAHFLYNDEYPKEFRVQTYRAYPHPDMQAAENKTNPYSLLDNPTGISVKANESLVVLVGDTQGQSISLKVQNLNKPNGDGFGGVSYPLSAGANKIKMQTDGLAYILYHTPDHETAPTIKIHFASGTESGYFDIAKHSTADWQRLLSNATDPYFDVLGRYAHLTFPTRSFREHTPDGKALIDAYDRMVEAQMMLLGLFKYDKVFKNRMYFNVMYHSYMYATSYHTAYIEGTMPALCNVDKLTTTECWGPAHEVGHCNQTRPGLKWIGTTEVTNNIMAQYVQTTILGQPSRVQTENLSDSGFRNRYSKAWTHIIAARAPHGDFETDDVFCKLIPFWQLELYFGKALGRTPTQQTDRGGFYPDVYEYIRTHPNLTTAGEQQTEFVYICSKAARMNLLDFFTKWGFLTPIEKTIDDYGTADLKVTQERIDEIRQRVEALGYEKPDFALEYISDNTYALYKDFPSIVKGTASVSKDRISLEGWKHVVAYEVMDEAGKLFYVSDGVTTPSNSAHFYLPGDWKTGYKLYAVSAKGDRVEVDL